MRILLVEDDAELAARLQAILEAAGFAVDHAADGETGRLLGLQEAYDAVVLDLVLPSLPGLEVLRNWRSRSLNMPVLVLTARGTWPERVAGLNTGADDYLAKPFEADELVARLRALIRRSGGRGETVLRHRDVMVDPIANRVEVAGESIELTALETRILIYLMHRRGQIVSQSQIAEHVYSSADMRDSNTVEVYIARLRKKLGRDMITTVRGLGYRLA